MKIRVSIIFGVSYSVLLAALTGADNLLSEVFDWNPAGEGIDSLLGLLFFVVAILLAVNRQAHAVFGEAPAPVAFRSRLSDNRWSLIIGIVFITTVVNLVIALVSSSYATGEIVWPSPLRVAILSIAYGVLARVIIVESVERMRYA